MARPSRRDCPALRHPESRARSGGFRKLQQFTRDFLGTNAKICRFAASRGGARNGAEKKVEAIRQEIKLEVEQFLRVVSRTAAQDQRFDLETTEMAMRAALYWAGAAFLTAVLASASFLLAGSG